MAQTVKQITFPMRLKAGGRDFMLVEVVLGTEYAAKGVAVKASDLGLSFIDLVVPVSEVLLSAEGAESFAPSLVPINFGSAGSEFKIQIFGSGAAKKEATFELADKAGTASEGKIFLFVVGLK